VHLPSALTSSAVEDVLAVHAAKGSSNCRRSDFGSTLRDGRAVRGGTLEAFVVFDECARGARALGVEQYGLSIGPGSVSVTDEREQPAKLWRRRLRGADEASVLLLPSSAGKLRLKW